MAVTAILSSRALATSLIQNGSFEDPALGPSGFVTGGGNDWTSAYTFGSFVGPGVWDDGYLSFTRIPAEDGHQVLWLPPGTSVSQNVALTAGTAYSLTFFTTAQRGNSMDTALLVSIIGGGQTISGSFNVAAGSSSWTGDELSFVANSTGMYSVELFGEDTWTLYQNSATQYLDNVSLVAVPDSGVTACLLVLGLAGVASLRTRVRWRR